MMKKLGLALKITGSSLAFLIVLGACTNDLENQQQNSRVEYLPYYQDAFFTPSWFPPDSDSLNNFHQIGDFELLNQDGKKVTNETFHNQIYVADFFFTACPGICPKMTKNMRVLQEAFFEDPEVALLSHSVTPSMDSVPILKDYAERMGVLSDKWHLVTGDRKTIYDLGRKHYFVEEDLGLAKREDAFLHTENFVLVDKNRHIRGIYNGLNKVAIQQLIADIHTLKKETQLP